MKKIWKFGILGVLIVLLGFGNWKEDVYAQGATAYFGTKEGYEWNVGEKSPMGFYLKSEEGNLTEVELIITYDPEILEFQSQKDKVVTLLSEGKLSIKKEGNLGTKYKKLLYFTPLISCDTTVEIVEAKGRVGEQEVNFEEIVGTQVTISLKKGCELESIEIDGESLKEFEPEQQRYQLEVENDVETLLLAATASEGTKVEISDTELKVGRNEITITTTNKKKQKGRYVFEVVRKEAGVGAEDTAAKLEETENIVEKSEEAISVGNPTTKLENSESVTGNIESAVGIENEKTELEDEIKEYIIVDESLVLSETNSEENKSSWKHDLLKLGIVLVILLVVFEIILLGVRIRKQQKRRKKKQEELQKQEIQLEVVIKEIDELEESEPKGEKQPPVVIRGKNICMDFDRAVNEYTSIKELAIQTIKGTRVTEKYRALNDISFEIRKGEVIGVIGTNGAGKSTLLKIIAGAMHPTGGSVEVNQSKIQILTLGTGFDMELTGRENVYLNGAIIGYDREFIDQHYDQIVEFAELQDFMNEKVKNYSSGMVSRLGFAIATVGEAAEILILDEVLSVGDRIFQKKSMKRIKEMIHGGSTVIMVSHSTKTISENCDRAIWIEKGQMIAMGEAKTLCAEYEKYDGDLERVMGVKKKLERVNIV